MNKLIAWKVAGRAPLLAAVAVAGLSFTLPGVAAERTVIDEIVVTAPRLHTAIEEMVVTAPRIAAPEVELLESIRHGVLRATVLAAGDSTERAPRREIRLAAAADAVDRG